MQYDRVEAHKAKIIQPAKPSRLRKRAPRHYGFYQHTDEKYAKKNGESEKVTIHLTSSNRVTIA
ncbi:hypothetical protein JCM19236_5634 [Vibrio sp. JCM 19236]|nr:hypothetical protein JCM19236_5634 [Vibrio sp. JCM 19236]